MPERRTKQERKRYIVIPNWDTYQHQDVWKKSGGRPPWIKTYTRLLNKDEYMDLTLAQRGLLHGVWMLYASAGGVLTTDTCRRLLSTNKGDSRHLLEHLEALSDAGLIHIQSHLEESREEEIRKTTSREPVDNSASSPQSPPDMLAHLRAQRGG